jgi:hypothetical protein
VDLSKRWSTPVRQKCGFSVAFICIFVAFFIRKNACLSEFPMSWGAKLAPKKYQVFGEDVRVFRLPKVACFPLGKSDAVSLSFEKNWRFP